MKNDLLKLRLEIKAHANLVKAKTLLRFFKTGPGEYAEGDKFYGLMVPQSREIARKYSDLSLADVEKLLHSDIHEERVIALFILVDQFAKGDAPIRQRIHDLYLANTKYINNWDLVDLSAQYLVGGHLRGKSKKRLEKLAQSKNLWERRIAIIATFSYIKEGDCAETFKISDILMNDNHDLIHKAVGWMLRESGKRCGEAKLEQYLKSRYQKMPRTMLRYAIERFPEQKRKKYLHGQI